MHAPPVSTSMRRRTAIAIAVGICLAASTASAQPSLNLKRVVSIWPTIEVYFTVACDGAPSYVNNPDAFRVFEQGREVTSFTQWCPDNTLDICLAVALVFDASGSMTGSGQAGAIAAGHAFIDPMGLCDEAAILWFNEKVTLEQGMTSSKSMLYMAINRLPSGGSTAAWDGMYEGLQEVIRNGANHGRAVIALTDGYDGSSTRTPSEVISLAQRNRIRVYTIGLGTSVDTGQLQMIADQTGGRFYQTPSAGELPVIYQEIQMIIFQGFQECGIRYESTCMDGSLRTVDLQLPDFCGGSVARTKAYRAPRDTATFTPLTIRAGSTVADRNATVKVPVMLVDSLYNEFFNATTFSVRVDDSLAQLQGVSTAGTLLDGVPLTVTPFAGGATIATKGRVLLNGAGPLFELTFTTADVQDGDTVHCAVSLVDWFFEAGCFAPRLEAGELVILPRPVGVSMPGAAAAFTVACHPNPASAEVEVRIDGAGAGPVSVTLVDALGRVQGVVRDLACGGQVSHRFAVGDMPPGVYFIIAATCDAVQLRKFVKVE